MKTAEGFLVTLLSIAEHRLPLRNMPNMDRCLDNVLQDGFVRPEIEALEDHPEPATQSVYLPMPCHTGMRFDLVRTDPDFTFARFFQEVEAPQESALPGATAAEN